MINNVLMYLAVEDWKRRNLELQFFRTNPTKLTRVGFPYQNAKYVTQTGKPN